jgi:SAM-dependent methyltransferase
MEALPFAPCSFDAITSQFGFEYSDRDRSAGEAARVLVSGGVLQFLIHHRDGPILAHNRPRAAALRWAAFDNGLLDKAVALVRARASASIPTPALFRDAPVRARHLFQAQSVAEEFTTAILQILELSRFEAHSKGLEALAALRMRAEGELGRIEALTAAACGRDEIEAIRRRLLVEGVVTVEPEPICEAGSARPFAWKLAGSKQA